MFRSFVRSGRDVLRISRHRIGALALYIALASGLLTGCLSVLPDGDIAQLAVVLADPAQFAQDPSDPLANIPAGTVIDPVSLLPGCWGASYEMEVPPGNPHLVGYQVLRFNSATRTLTRFTVNDLGGAQVLDVWSGDWEVIDEGRLSFDVRRVQSNVPGFTQLTDITDRYATLPSYEVRITRDDDRIKVMFVTPSDDPRTPAGFLENVELIHQRFECAE